jgi:hypothetical protein
VGVTAGRFEQLIREEVIPDPIIVDGSKFWDARLLDQVRQAVEQRGKEFVYPERSPALRVGQGECAKQGPASPVYCLPDQAWLEARASLVARVRRSLLSQNEMGLLREFKLSRSDQVGMFGCYKSFEALMARGYLVEVSRSGPLSRQLVTYRLTEQGTKIVASMNVS